MFTWKDKLVLCFVVLLMCGVLVMCAAFDTGHKISNVIGNTEIRKYQDESGTCFVTVNIKSEEVNALSCFKR